MAADDSQAPGTAKAPPTLGEGCVKRYDPEALSEEDGTEFEGAEALWQRLQRERQEKPDQ